MSAPTSAPPAVLDTEPQANLDHLAEATTATATQVFAMVAERYLAFRRVYYHEEQPSLATIPPAHAGIHQGDIARAAESTLRLVPKVVKSVPLLGGFLVHLEQVANLHSITERERTALHNLTMTFLHGVTDGIQPWLVTWLLASAQHLSKVSETDYYLRYPWDGLLYLQPKALAAFESALRTGDVAAIERAIEHLGQRLVDTLRDPISAQPELAFTGPDAERRRRVFHLKTTLALALGAYLIADEVHGLLHPPEPAQERLSVLEPLPAGAMAPVAATAHAESVNATLWTARNHTND